MPKFVVIDAYINTVPGGRDFTPLIEVCEREGYDILIEDLRDTKDIIDKVKDADGIITTYTKIDKEILDHCSNLKIAIRAAIGPDVFNLDDCTAANVPACNIPTYCTEEVASHTATLVLAILRKLKICDDLVRKGIWDINCMAPSHRISTLSLGFIGFGRIGRKTYNMLKNFNFNVRVCDPYLSDASLGDLDVKRSSFDELLGTSDIIVVNTPLNDDTYHLIDKKAVEKMKDGVCFVNTGRGGCVETAAVIEGLKSGKISGVGLDVLEEEPLKDPDAEILKFDNVIITPHTAYYSIEARKDLYKITGETIVRVMNGELPDNVLNRKELLEKYRK